MLAFIAHVLPGPRTIDDAFITFRYARNILAGSGFVYNPGEHVLGTTTPLYTLLLTGIGLVMGGEQAPFPQISLLINALAAVGTCFLLIKLGQRLGSPRAGLAAALVWGIAPYSVTFSVGGLETSLYVFFLIATVYYFVTHAHLSASVFAACAVLTRPDALILIGPLALERFSEETQLFLSSRRNSTSNRSSADKAHWRSLLLEAALFLIPLLLWLAFATYYFGSPLPHSIEAKSLAYRLPATAALTRLLQHYATPFFEHNIFGIPWIAVGLVLYPFLYLIGASKIFKEEKRTLAFLVYPWLYLITFAIANPLIFRWYLTPPLPLYFLIIFIGASKIIETLILSRRKFINENTFNPPLLKFSIFVVMLLPFTTTLTEWRIVPDHGLDRPAPEMAWYQLELLYTQAADYLRPQFGENSVLAAGDVGVLGYRTNAPILDTVGLNSRQAIAYYPLDPEYYVINYAVPPDLIFDEKPDFIVVLEAYVRNGLLKEEEFLASYRLIKKIPTDIYGSDGMLLFRRIP